MSRGAFGQPTEGAPLDPDEVMGLVVDIYRFDQDTIVEWSKARLVTRSAHVQFIFTLAALAANLMKATADREYGKEDRFGRLELAPGASRAEAMTGRLVAASLNDDNETLQALMHSLIEHTERTEDVDDIAQVEVGLVSLLHFLLNELAPKP